MLTIPAPTARQRGVTWAHRATRAATAGAIAAVTVAALAAAGPLLMHQPSQPNAGATVSAAHCSELCGLPAASRPTPA